MIRPLALRSILIPAVIVVAGACVSRPVDAPGPRVPDGVTRTFDLIALGGGSVSSATTRGRSTLVIVITTYDIPSQYVARECAQVMRTHRPRINAFAIVLEPPRNAPLVEAFGTLLGLPFPLVMGDDFIRSEEGPFGAMVGVPTLIVLDRVGREVWRRSGAASARDIERALSTADSVAGI